MGKLIDVKVIRKDGKNLAFIKTLENGVPVIHKFWYESTDSKSLEAKLNELQAVGRSLP